MAVVRKILLTGNGFRASTFEERNSEIKIKCRSNGNMVSVGSVPVISTKVLASENQTQDKCEVVWQVILMGINFRG